MKKVAVLAASLCYLFSSLSAQTKKVDLDNLLCTIEYRETPKKLLAPRVPLVPGYLCLFRCSNEMQSLIGDNRVIDGMEIQGLEKVYNHSDADIYYQINMPDMRIVSDGILERQVEHDGKMVSLYYVEMRYAVTAVGYIILPSYYRGYEGEVLFSQSIPCVPANNKIVEGTEIYHSEERLNRQEVEDFWYKNRANIIRKIIMERVAVVVKNANSIMSERIGFPAAKTYFYLVITDEDKHNENADFRAATQIVKAMFEGMTPDNGLQLEEIAKEIEYFKSVVDRYKDPKHKADIRLRYAALRNLFGIYYFLDDAENAEKYARLVILNDYKTNRTTVELRNITLMRETFRKTGITTRHFSPNNIYITEMHGNNSQQSPLSNIEFLNNGYYDGYRQGWQDSYEKNHQQHLQQDPYPPINNKKPQQSSSNSGVQRSVQSIRSTPSSATHQSKPSTVAPSRPAATTRPAATKPATTTRPAAAVRTPSSRPATARPAVSKPMSTSPSTKTEQSKQDATGPQRPSKTQTGSR